MAKVAVQRGARNQPGIAIDAQGGAVIDPTKNVLDLVDGQVVRLNDLQEAYQKLNDAKLAHITQVVELRADCQKEISDLRAAQSKELTVAESGRLNAIRQVDQLNVTTTAAQAEAAIKALAAQTAANADNIQKALTATAQAIATQTATTVGAITERIAALEKASYTGQGKSTLSDPAMVEMMAEIKLMRTQQQTSAGQGEGKSAMWGYVVGAIGLVLTLLGIGTALLNLRGP